MTAVRSRRRYTRGNAMTEYLVVLVGLMAIWLTSDVLLNAVNTYYGNFVTVLSQTSGGEEP